MATGIELAKDGYRARGHIQEAFEIIDMWYMDDEIGEDCARLCADTQIMLAIHSLQDMRRKLREGRDW